MSLPHSSFFDCLIPIWSGDSSLIGVTLRPDIARQIYDAQAKSGKDNILTEPVVQISMFTCHHQTEPWLFFTDSADFKRHVAREGKPAEPRR